MAGKYDGESMAIVLSEQRHVALLDCGGLWRVTSDVTSKFKVAEYYYKYATEKPATKIDCQTYCIKPSDKSKSSATSNSYS